MRAAYVLSPDPRDPARAVAVGEVAEPEPPAGWVPVDVRAASLNMHDVWMLRGATLGPGSLPLVLGSDAAGTSGGRDVLVHAVLPDRPGTLAPGSTLLCDGGFGTLTSRTWVPPENLVDKPAWLGWERAACLPTAWLTAWRMLVTLAGVGPGTAVLVQGAGGGVATAAASLARAHGCRVHVTSRSPAKRERALALGADSASAPGERLPELVDVVVESVGAATWSHSLKSLRPGGTLVVCGAATGFDAATDLGRVFARQLRILGSTMGGLDELRDLVAFVDEHRVEPVVDSSGDLDEVPRLYQRLVSGEAFGKVCVRPG